MKKVLIGVLASAVAFTVTALPVAAAPVDSTDSTAGIQFDSGNLEPGGPDVDVDGVVKNLNFYFGSWEVSSSNETYDSVDNADAPYNGMGQKVGYIVTNNTGSVDEGWEVTVEISDFTVDSAPAMQGFTLTMTPEQNYPKPSNETSTIGNLAPTAKTIDLEAGHDNTEVLFHAAKGQGRGTWGANWTGELKVLGGTAKAGDAKATMTWNLQAV